MFFKLLMFYVNSLLYYKNRDWRKYMKNKKINIQKKNV